MLTWTTVIKYVKGLLSFPSNFLEYSDQEIQDFITEQVIPEFSQYIPDIAFAPIIPSETRYQTGKDGFYYLFDDEDLDIYGLRNVYFSESADVASGHPIIGPSTFDQMPQWTLDTFKARFLAPVSLYDNRTKKFYPPNIIQILPATTDTLLVEYEREQPHDLRKIPPAVKRDFMNLALAECKIWLSDTRDNYTNIAGPFGEIPVNTADLRSEGETLRDRTIEKLSEFSIPSVIIDIC